MLFGLLDETGEDCPELFLVWTGGWEGLWDPVRKVDYSLQEVQCEYSPAFLYGVCITVFGPRQMNYFTQAPNQSVAVSDVTGPAHKHCLDVVLIVNVLAVWWLIQELEGHKVLRRNKESNPFTFPIKLKPVPLTSTMESPHCETQGQIIIEYTNTYCPCSTRREKT